MSSRSELLQGEARSFCEEYAEWQADSGRPYADRRLFRAVESLTDTFRAGEIPADCRALARAVADLQDELAEYDDRANVDDQPRDSFWAACESIRNRIVELEAPPPLKPLESIAELAALPNMTHEQIARMYGFKDKHGRLLLHLVARELKEPGSVISTPGGMDGADWVDPRERKRKERLGIVSQEAAERSNRRKEAAEESPKVRKPCPETPLELFEQGVSVEQAARMLMREPSEVAAAWQDFAEDAEQAKANSEAKQAAEKAASVSARAKRKAAKAAT